MKKIFILAILAIGMIASAQTTVKSDKVLNYEYTDTLNKDEIVYQYYYVPNFPATIKVQAQADSIVTGYTKVNFLTYGSLDYVNWYPIGDTIELASTDADSDTLTYSNNYWTYYRQKVWAVDSTQYTDFNFQILFDIN